MFDVVIYYLFSSIECQQPDCCVQVGATSYEHAAYVAMRQCEVKSALTVEVKQVGTCSLLKFFTCYRDGSSFSSTSHQWC